MPGSSVASRPDSLLKIRVERGEGRRLVVRTSTGTVEERVLSAADREIEIRLSTIGAFFVRAELREGSAMRAMTNAVFVR